MKCKVYIKVDKKDVMYAHDLAYIPPGENYEVHIDNPYEKAIVARLSINGLCVHKGVEIPPKETVHFIISTESYPVSEEGSELSVDFFYQRAPFTNSSYESNLSWTHAYTAPGQFIYVIEPGSTTSPSSEELYRSYNFMMENYEPAPFDTIEIVLLPGLPFSKMQKFCTECGTGVKAGIWKYCPECGTKLGL